MHEFPSKFADLVEGVAAKVRAMTVDRVARFIKLTGLGIVAAVMGFTAVVFLIWTIFGALEIPLTTAGAFAVFGVVLVIAGGFLWFKRSRNDT
jgi:LPXTG-motif cell wall-anchored protein